MSIDARDVFVFGAPVLLAFAAWSLRPQQRRAVSSRWFIGGANDGVFRLLFTAGGLPRKYAWVFPLLVALVFIALVSFLLPPRGT